MDRKERTVKILKRALSAAVFILPCLVYYIITKGKAGDALLYTAPFLWVVAAVSLAAALFSYVVLRRGSVAADAEYTDETLPESENMPEAVHCPDPLENMEEYPEFSKIPAAEKEESKYDYASDIAMAIKAQKADGISDKIEKIPADDGIVWDAPHGEKEAPVFDEIYENLPDTLPEGYEIREEEIEEAEYSGGYSVRKPKLGETVLSKVLCIIISLAVSAGIAVLFSRSITTETVEGYCDGKEYIWSDVTEVTVSQKLFGSLSVEVTASDGRKTELFPATLMKGEKFGEKYESIYAYMAHAVREMRKNGAEVKIEDRESITATYKDTEDGSWKYISEITEVQND